MSDNIDTHNISLCSWVDIIIVVSETDIIHFSLWVGMACFTYFNKIGLKLDFLGRRTSATSVVDSNRDVFQTAHYDIEENEHDKCRTIDNFRQSYILRLDRVDELIWCGQRERWLSDFLLIVRLMAHLMLSQLGLLVLIIVGSWRLWCATAEQLSNTALEDVRTNPAWHRIMLLITGNVDDNDRYNEGQADQVECVAVECHCAEEWERFY